MAAFDARFRQRFLALHEKAAHGDLEHWTGTAGGALALLLLLDQFPRNAFRGTARMYATDAKARAIADLAIERGFDQSFAEDLRLFFYLPFAHSERLADQDRSVELNSRMAEPDARIPGGIATSSGASGAFRIATRCSAG